MTEGAILQLISTTGAAVVLFWVVYQFITGKLHSNSELEARDATIETLERMNETVVGQLKQTNDIFERAIERGYTTVRERQAR